MSRIITGTSSLTSASEPLANESVALARGKPVGIAIDRHGLPENMKKMLADFIAAPSLISPFSFCGGGSGSSSGGVVEASPPATLAAQITEVKDARMALMV